MNPDKTLRVMTTIQAPLSLVWEVLTTEKHIPHWHWADEHWHTPYAHHDFKVGGMFNYHYAAKDGSVEFDLIGTFTAIESLHALSYTLGDGRKVDLRLKAWSEGVDVIEYFEAENIHSHEQQLKGWQAILDHLKAYTETLI